MNLSKQQQRKRRHTRVRAKINGTAEIPRVSVFRSNKHIFVQLIDDKNNKTLISNALKSQDKPELKGKKTKTNIAGLTGEKLALEAKEKGISTVVFDRGGYKYHGRVKALAEGLRKGGLKF